MHIQCSRMTTAPGREVDISWSGEGIGNEIGEFNGRGQSSRLGGTEDDVPDGIVSHDPISIPSTSNLVVADACTRSLQGEGYFTVRMRMSISFFACHACYTACITRLLYSQLPGIDLMLLHVHKNDTDKLDLIDVANDFIDSNEHRKHFFGTEFQIEIKRTFSPCHRHYLNGHGLGVVWGGAL